MRPRKILHSAMPAYVHRRFPTLPNLELWAITIKNFQNYIQGKHLVRKIRKTGFNHLNYQTSPKTSSSVGFPSYWFQEMRPLLKYLCKNRWLMHLAFWSFVIVSYKITCIACGVWWVNTRLEYLNTEDFAPKVCCCSCNMFIMVFVCLNTVFHLCCFVLFFFGGCSFYLFLYIYLFIFIYLFTLNWLTLVDESWISLRLSLIDCWWF